MVTEVALTLDLAIIILSATLAGFAAKRTGQPTIIAYILVGVVIGPAALGIVEVSELTDLLSELGLAFLLFLLGIKMRLDDVRHVLTPIVKISIPQMLAIFLAGMGVALALPPFGLLESFLIGLAVMYSSTAVVIKMLNDKDEATSLHGKIDVGVLLVQDIVVVIILAVLAAGRPDDLAEVATTLAVVLVLVAIITVAAIGASQSVLPTVFRRIADDKEVFFLVALSWAFLFVFVSENINLFLEPFGITAYLSIEMGAFMAGLALAQLPYSKELQDRVNPLTDLFVMVFFVSVALDLRAAELLAHWHEAIIAGLVLMPVKFLVFFYLLDWQGFDSETTFLGSINMIQVSEFGIIVAAVAYEGDFIPAEVLGFMTLLAIFTMSVSVYLVEFNHALYDRFEAPIDRWTGDREFESGKREYRDHAVVIGYDEVTKNSLPLLADNYEDVVVVDRTVSHIETLEEEGYDVIFGDARNATIRKDAAVKKADFVLSSAGDPAVNEALLRDVSDDATVFVEAKRIEHARDLYDSGAHCVIMTPYLAADRLAEYLRTYLEEEEDVLMEAIDSDVELLETPDPLPEARSRLGGGLDE
ncbi:cation:proton antiporter [Natronobacterium texcoconense]|uniref:Kef-type K+ transport system, membrane component KefB n=1 Tax=Natronobacterium texcoconense TaxID=1095778 RepID=A0A1H1EHH8_NATTX|nr:cation:proton antiporter [Natronobacterium texcoconense]SDQ88010.1 Kef-type K+ transport system, membrane component KefB [Natronobacterium texcoconense]